MVILWVNHVVLGVNNSIHEPFAFSCEKIPLVSDETWSRKDYNQVFVNYSSLHDIVPNLTIVQKIEWRSVLWFYPSRFHNFRSSWWHPFLRSLIRKRRAFHRAMRYQWCRWKLFREKPINKRRLGIGRVLQTSWPRRPITELTLRTVSIGSCICHG